MSTKYSISKKTRIQKFKGKFKEIKGGGTILFTKTIQSVTDPECLAVYVYLASKPPEWNANVKELMDHFKNMGRDKIRKCLSDLCMIGLLKRVRTRDEDGKMGEYDYYLYLQPAPENQAVDEPAPEKPGPGKPAPVNQGAYKEESSCIKNIECKKDFFKTPSRFDQQEYAAYLKRGEPIPKKYLHVEEWRKQSYEKAD